MSHNYKSSLGGSIIPVVGQSIVAIHPPAVGHQPTAGHPTLAGHGVSTLSQNIQDRMPQQQSTLQSWKVTQRQEAW
jgi:hypothetical protein